MLSTTKNANIYVWLAPINASDSGQYEKCLIRSANLFGRARVLMLAELVFFQNLLRRGPSDRVVLSINVFKPTETLVQRSTAGFIVFTTASLVLLISWSIGEFVGSLVIGENFGNVWMSIGSLLVNASIPCGIILSLSSSASDGNGRKWGKEEDIGSNSEWYTRYLRSAMLLVLGSSGGKSHLHRNEHQWQGRLLFLQDKMARISDETVVECKSMIHSLDANIQASEASIKEAFHELKSNLQEASTKHNQTNEQLMKLLLKVLATADDLPYT